MKLFDQINLILGKGLYNLTAEDKRELIGIKDQLGQDKADTVDTILRLGQEVDAIEDLRTLELKEMTNEEGKKKYTEVQIKSMIGQEVKDKKTDINIAKYKKERIENKIDVLNDYITALRDQLKIKFNSSENN